jgi:hypothetical protein
MENLNGVFVISPIIYGTTNDFLFLMNRNTPRFVEFTLLIHDKNKIKNTYFLSDHKHKGKLQFSP